MNARLSLVLLAVPFALPAVAAESPGDLPPPAQRAAQVAAAEGLAVRSRLAPAPAETPSPFAPLGFEGTDPADPKGAAGLAEKPRGDRETLELLAAQLSPSGVIVLRGSHLLILSNRQHPAGTRFTVSHQGQEHELLLTEVTRTTYTLRYREEETTRTIKSVPK
ncbi:MAG: hypothetical protein ACO3G4_02245 [Opitutaceae bacterium]